MKWQTVIAIAWMPMGIIGVITSYPFVGVIGKPQPYDLDIYTYIFGPLALPLLAYGRVE
jgi:hypothetical protein